MSVSGEQHPAIHRIERDHDGEPLFDALVQRLRGADLSTLLMAVMDGRARRRSPADILRQYERDRFVRPGTVEARRLIEVERIALEAAYPTFDPVVTAPVAPLGAHAVVTGISQNRVVSTTRGTEVAADPTMSLALEAALRRRDLLAAGPRSSTVVRLSAIDRVTRAQLFSGPRSFAHFSLLGLVSAGRDTGSHTFEIAELRRHVDALTRIVGRLGVAMESVVVSDVGGQPGSALDRLVTALRDDGHRATVWPERTAGREYYADLCFKVVVRHGDELIEAGDGGAVGWTAALLGNAKERLVISGLGLERLAPLAPFEPTP